MTIKVINGIKELSTYLSARQGFCKYTKQQAVVENIIRQIAEEGDKALLALTQKYDQVKLSSIYVKPTEITKAKKEVSKRLIDALRVAYKNIYEYHKNQLPLNWKIKRGEASYVGMRYLPVERAGVYVPGGSAVYPSSVLMNVIPAKVAGVEEILLAVPPQKNGKIHPAILAAADICGIDKIIKAGGAQAIAAMALGTKKIPKVDIITGPGNIYVTLAKQLLFGRVGIDKLAGPSDSVLVVDGSTNIEYAAYDLLTQLEHDPLASAFLIGDSKTILNKILETSEKIIKQSSRQEILKQSLKNGTCTVVTKNPIVAVNLIAPEHLHLFCKKAEKLAEEVKHAGAIFIGKYSPEVLGDYLAGPNHVLPTEGTARFASPLMVTDFMKASSIINYSQVDFMKIKPHLISLAEEEKLDIHQKAAEVRL